MESSYPTEVAHHIYKLGQTHGHAKISYTLMSKVSHITYSWSPVLTEHDSQNLPTGIMDLMQGYLKYGAEFQVGKTHLMYTGADCGSQVEGYDF